MINLKPQAIFALFIVALFTTDLYSQEEIVRVEFEYSGTIKFLDIELFPDVAPLTVANYLDYVNTGSYDSSFVTRAIPSFVLQSGGYTFRPADPINDLLRPISEGTGLEEVPLSTLSPVTNEPGLSNKRGTVALAKLAGKPDSGTNAWFINLADNSDNLDSQNGGFTVFGSVIDDGTTIIADDIGRIPSHLYADRLLGPAFDNMPVTGDIFGGVYRSDLVMINSITSINRPIIRFDYDAVDFDLDIAGDATPESFTVTVKNTGNETLIIGTIDQADLTAPFSIANETCSNSTLLPQSSVAATTCIIQYNFNPAALDTFTGSVTVPYSSQSSGDSFSVSQALTGIGVPATPVIKSSTSGLNYTGTIIRSSTDQTLNIRNEGGGILEINSLVISGESAGDYSVQSGCSSGTRLSLETACTVTIRFSPITEGAKIASLDITSNAGTSNVTLVGVATAPKLTVQSTFDITTQYSQAISDFILVTNSGTGNLTLSDISISGAESSFFTQLNNCPGTNNLGSADAPLGETQQCAIQLTYLPTQLGIHNATLTITSDDPNSPTSTVTLTGRTGDSQISTASNFFVGTSQAGGQSTSNNLTIRNIGQAPLIISSITEAPNTAFSQTNTCTGTGVQILAGDSCIVTITYQASNNGFDTSTLTIDSNDPATPSITVAIEGFGEQDTDGIPLTVEDNGTNSGDGNNDGVQDSNQNNVASFLAPDGSYVTLVSDTSLTQNVTTFIENLTLDGTTAVDIGGQTTSFQTGLQAFTVDLPVGDSVNVAMFLPANSKPGDYYLYGSTQNDSSPHWYNFKYDATTQTGSSLLGKYSIRPQTGGSKIDRYIVLLTFIDGGPGDDDMAANGKITVTRGGLSFPDTKPSAGSMSYAGIMIIFLLAGLRRRCTQIQAHSL